MEIRSRVQKIRKDEYGVKGIEGGKSEFNSALNQQPITAHKLPWLQGRSISKLPRAVVKRP